MNESMSIIWNVEWLECEWPINWDFEDEEQSVYPHEKIIGKIQRVLEL